MPQNAFARELVPARQARVNWDTQYGVYFSNLKDSDIDILHKALKSTERYSGYVDVTYSGAIRNYLAATLTSHWLIVGRTIIGNHGENGEIVGDEDPVGYGFSEAGFTFVGLADAYHSGFLSYKIESNLPGSEAAVADRILTLAAVTGEVVNFDDVRVYVDPPKVYDYLLKDPDKLRLMTSVGLQEVTPTNLEEVILDRLARNYVYDLRFAVDATPLFASSAEFSGADGHLARRLIGLKYEVFEKRISLVTMY